MRSSRPTSSSGRRPRATRGSRTACCVPAGNNVDPSAELGRTREAIVGIQHELISNLAVGVDYIYRKYDKGTATYTQGYQPGAPGLPAVADLHRAADVHGSGDGPERAVLRRSARVRAPVRRRLDRDDEPQLRDLSRRRYHGDQAVQQPLADAGGADAPDQPELLPGRVGDVHQPDHAAVPGRRQHDRAAGSSSCRAATRSRGTSSRPAT